MLRFVVVLTFVAACAAGPIREARFVRVGGIDQWITIRGENRANPILLVVHGGPGDPQSPFPTWYAPYEHDFTVVQWDQPGAGKTYGKNPTVAPVPARVIGDGIELTRYLERYLDKPKLIVLGHSWGSYLAVGMVQRAPELYYALVGTGQTGSFKESIQAQFDFLLEHARAAGDEATVKKLEAIGTPDPTDAHAYFSWWHIVHNPYIAKSDQQFFATLFDLLRTDPEIKAESDTVDKGMSFSGQTTVGDMLATDLPKTAPKLDVPFIVIEGAEDIVTPVAVSKHYFNVVQAPFKKWIEIPNAGHFALVTHTAQFRDALVHYVRPLAR
jgi:pimeloyl-ACP methyl ester carboxylesterase